MQPLRVRTKVLIALGALVCVALAVACVVCRNPPRRPSKRETFVASLLEEAHNPWSCSFYPLTGGGNVNVRTILQLLAAYGEKNVIIDPSIQGDWCGELDGTPICVALDLLALEQNAVVRTVSQDLVRVERAPMPFDEDLLAELAKRLEVDRPHTMRARSLIAAIALHRGREVPEGLLPVQ